MCASQGCHGRFLSVLLVHCVSTSAPGPTMVQAGQTLSSCDLADILIERGVRSDKELGCMVLLPPPPPVL